MSKATKQESAVNLPTAQPSVLTAMAAQYGMERRAFEEIIRRTVLPDPECGLPELVAFLHVAQRYDLNPITREIHAFKRKDGGLQPIVGIDGWLKVANREAAFDGITFDDQFAEDGTVAAITARVFRKDRGHPIEVTEYMAECRRSTIQWQQWPRRMLRHKATIQALRYAFGIVGIMDEDEFDRGVAAERAAAKEALRGGVDRLRAAINKPPVQEPVVYEADTEPADLDDAARHGDDDDDAEVTA